MQIELFCFFIVFHCFCSKSINSIQINYCTVYIFKLSRQIMLSIRVEG